MYIVSYRVTGKVLGEAKSNGRWKISAGIYVCVGMDVYLHVPALHCLNLKYFPKVTEQIVYALELKMRS